MRKTFSQILEKRMHEDEDIYLITADLGYGMFDRIRAEFPSRFYNVGSAEQLMMLTAIGLALSGKKPITYTITPFYWRCAEMIRNYLKHENISVLMIGSGRDDDYAHDGFSHSAWDAEEMIPYEVSKFWFKDIENLCNVFEAYNWVNPAYFSLKR